LRQLEKSKTKEHKKNRLKCKFLAMSTDEAKAKKERANRAGTYKSGMNMADGTVDGYTEADLKLAATSRRPKNSQKNIVCCHCGILVPEGIPPAAALLEEEDVPVLAGHIGTAARNSLVYALRNTANFDSYPLMEDPPSDISLSAFQDADTWSDREDDALSVGDL
jgi:hypothetical protein